MTALNAVQATDSRPVDSRPSPPAPAGGSRAAPRPAPTAADAAGRPAEAPPYDPAQIRETVAQAIDQLQQALDRVSPDLVSVSYRNDESQHGIVIEIKNALGDVIRQWPPEKLLNQPGKMDDLVGVIIDETT